MSGTGNGVRVERNGEEGAWGGQRGAVRALGGVVGGGLEGACSGGGGGAGVAGGLVVAERPESLACLEHGGETGAPAAVECTVSENGLGTVGAAESLSVALRA